MGDQPDVLGVFVHDEDRSTMSVGEHPSRKTTQRHRNVGVEPGPIAHDANHIEILVEEVAVVAREEQMQSLVEVNGERSRTADADRKVRRLVLEVDRERLVTVLDQAPDEEVSVLLPYAE